MTELKLTQKTSGSISKFGLRNCLLAYKLNQVDGEGPTVISYTAGIETIANANRAIDAGREYAKKMNIPTSILIMMAEGFCRN